MAESLALPVTKDLSIQSRCRSHPPVRCRDLDSLLEADQASGAVINADVRMTVCLTWRGLVQHLSLLQADSEAEVLGCTREVVDKVL